MRKTETKKDLIMKNFGLQKFWILNEFWSIRLWVKKLRQTIWGKKNILIQKITGS